MEEKSVEAIKSAGFSKNLSSFNGISFKALTAMVFFLKQFDANKSTNMNRYIKKTKFFDKTTTINVIKLNSFQRKLKIR